MQSFSIALYVCLAIAASAQQPAFEVASIKPSNYQGGPLRVTARIDPDGIDFSNVTARLCLQRAYGVKPYQLTGPQWIDTERYMIVAKAGGPAPPEKILLMLQALLADRFKLAIHRETKEMPIYALVVAKGGPKLREATGDGATRIAPQGDDIVFERVSMDQLAGVIARSVDRPVIDATGLKGLYNFTMPQASSDRPSPDVGAAGDAPSIFEAVEELGLRLETRKAPIDMLSVDHIEKPSPN